MGLRAREREHGRGYCYASRHGHPVEKVSAVIPTVTSKDTHFNAMRDQSDMEDEEPNALHAFSTALSTLDNEIKANNRDLNSRLMALENLSHLGY